MLQQLHLGYNNHHISCLQKCDSWETSFSQQRSWESRVSQCQRAERSRGRVHWRGVPGMLVERRRLRTTQSAVAFTWKYSRRRTWVEVQLRNKRARKCTRQSAGEWACMNRRGKIQFGCQLEVYGRTLWRWNWAPAAWVNRSSLHGVGPEQYLWLISLMRTHQCRKRRRTCHWIVLRKPARTHTPCSKLSRLKEYPWGLQISWIVSTMQASAGMLSGG